MKPPHDATRLWRTLWRVADALVPLYCRLHVAGREHVPATGGCVLACNHTMGPDYFFLAYAAPRQVHYMAKAELFQIHPLLSRLLDATGVFPVRRGQRDQLAIQRAVALVRSGRVLGMFPEGTRSRSGVLQRGRTGVARIALQAGVPVVPAVVIDAEKAMPRRWRPWRRPQVWVRFGPPLMGEGDPGDPDLLQAFTQAVMMAMAELLPPERQGEYAAGLAAPR